MFAVIFSLIIPATVSAQILPLIPPTNGSVELPFPAVLSMITEQRKNESGEFPLSKNIGRLARITNNYRTTAAGGWFITALVVISTTVFLSLDSATLPCCRDRFGQLACQALRKFQAEVFEKRCLNDHDFHTIDCCMECRSYIENYRIHPENARTIFKAPVLCKDKHSIGFCRRFKNNGMGKYSCSDAEFAMRVCRQSCGYCNDDLYSFHKATPPCK